MSHVKSVDIVVSDAKALEAACKEIKGLTFVRNQKEFAWYGSWQNDYSGQDAAYIRSGIKPKDYGKCDHAIKVEGSGYEIGVVKNPKGKGYVLVFDNWGTGHKIEQLLGPGLEKLKQAYAVSAATLAAKAKGWSVKKEVLGNGTIKLCLTGV